jgi:predicted deacylase
MKGLEKILRGFKKSACDGVSGVMRIDGPKPGPVLGITACTHGNEPAGLAIFHHILNDLNIRETLECGTLYLVVNNVRAAEKFFASETEEQWSECRAVKVNMNRLPKDVLSSKSRKYELARTRELRPIWERFTYGLDIHSTLGDTLPMIISRGNNFDRIANLVRGFPIKVLISNIDAIQINKPAFAFYGADSTVPVFAIEAGQHTKSVTLKTAQTCAKALLQNLGMFPGVSEASRMEYEEYEIADSMMFPDKSFDLVRKFDTFCRIQKGDLLAKSKGRKGVKRFATFDGHLILPTPKRGEAKDITEEVSFISLPMKKRKAT